jgi:FtsH-binding integral membrane protein
MAEYDRQTLNARASSAAAIDEGLRSYMLRVYNYMGIGLVVTGLVAYFANARWSPSGAPCSIPARSPGSSCSRRWLS